MCFRTFVNFLNLKGECLVLKLPPIFPVPINNNIFLPHYSRRLSSFADQPLTHSHCWWASSTQKRTHTHNKKHTTRDSRECVVWACQAWVSKWPPTPGRTVRTGPSSGHYCIPPWKPAKRDLWQAIRTVFWERSSLRLCRCNYSGS